jgi:hypothetical protein
MNSDDLAALGGVQLPSATSDRALGPAGGGPLADHSAFELGE